MTVLTKKNCTKVNSEQIHELHISKSWSSDDIPREPDFLLKNFKRDQSAWIRTFSHRANPFMDTSTSSISLKHNWIISLFNDHKS